MTEKTTWRKEITQALQERKETWADVEAHTLDDDQLDQKFDPGFSGTGGVAFTLWTRNYVYFPGCYDGAEWADSVPRNPCNEATTHIGGG